jgi:hypothetical protein
LETNITYSFPAANKSPHRVLTVNKNSGELLRAALHGQRPGATWAGCSILTFGNSTFPAAVFFSIPPFAFDEKHD